MFRISNIRLQLRIRMNHWSVRYKRELNRMHENLVHHQNDSNSNLDNKSCQNGKILQLTLQNLPFTMLLRLTYSSACVVQIKSN